MSVVVRHPRFAELVARRMLRGKIERAVERLLAVLDEIDGDPDLEPSNGGSQDADRNAATVDAEGVDEDGGDILDEPHDAEPDEDDGTAEPDERELPKSEAEADAWFPT